MPTYQFKCDDCGIVREVHMSVSTFDEGGKCQTCSKCKEPMRQLYSAPYVIYRGKGFYTTDHKKKVDPKNEVAIVDELTEHYEEQAHKRGNYDAAKDATETFVVDKYRNTKTGKAEFKPVIVPPIRDD